eukprot:gnl/TRDRNA2_/TRDRNA2_198225_c0_seq1.p1 gnl/TRDRNA2_/TRDRNA2_198225_c0~~gnl/TRDRNA2_/TRDRNA2_198225_c0_seq1.p1  ORF type:complete len:133 (+),score=3.38 gnl/TRDRNA2_/TRDRNA2_198225_c0_seq1:55-453(+)
MCLCLNLVKSNSLPELCMHTCTGTSTIFFAVGYKLLVYRFKDGRQALVIAVTRFVASYITTWAFRLQVEGWQAGACDRGNEEPGQLHNNLGECHLEVSPAMSQHACMYRLKHFWCTTLNIFCTVVYKQSVKV